MEIIESLENTKIKNICKLHQKKYRDEKDNFIVEGDHLVNEAYKNGVLLEVYALPTTNINMNIKVNYVTNNVMSKISSMESISNIIGIVKKYIPKTYGKRLLILDNIQDPGNLGTIIRSACAFNIDTIILGNTCVDLYNDKAIRATEGMLFNIDIMRFELESLISELKNNNYTIMGTNVINGTPLNKVTFNDKFAIVIGSEGQGISENIQKLISDNIYIPMNKKCESLNAGVAASIIMYEMSKVDYE